MTDEATTRATVDGVRLPRVVQSPLTQVLRRIAFALALVVFVALVVRIGRDGYTDSAGGPIGFLDALYYASVTVTTTGYGDITAHTSGARLATIVLITPARILFLILVVGTTVEVLTDQSRQLMAIRRWRNSVRDHYVVCGYGSTGQAAVRDLIDRGVSVSEIVAVDTDPTAIAEAAASGIVGVVGDATSQSVLTQAGIADARAVIIVPNRDDTAVLITLTARELNPDANIVVGGREQENLHLLHRGGADEVIDATAALGRMLGLGAHAPGAVHVIEDVLDAGSGLEVAEVAGNDVPHGCNIVAVIRDGKHLLPAAVDIGSLGADDRVVVLRVND